MRLRLNREKLRDFFDGKNKVRIAVVLGIIGMVLIMLSEVVPKGDEGSEIVYDDSLAAAQDETEVYKNQIQQELTSLLQDIEGVGECSVMVTVEGTTEYVYAENVNKSTDSDSQRTSDNYQNDIVIIEKDGEKQALVKKIIKPQINGVVVVCSGGGNAAVSERVIKAVATALNLSSSKICVEEKTLKSNY